jgi:quinol monooxygenase YgiN
MAFIQSIEFSADDKEAVLEFMGRWSADAIGNGTAQRGTMAEDRSAPGRFVMAVWFESAEAAEENSSRPETGAFAEQFESLCSDGPTYREFEVVDVYGG